MKNKRIFIIVKGIVQGVGFRPFVYNLAKHLDLKGWVNNNSEGVYIDIEGPEENIDLFLNSLNNEAPPLSKIEDLEIAVKDIANFNSFDIKESLRDENSITLISPDMATCDDCREDILSRSNKRYKYAFTNCTNCGPRFSIIKDIPYDRDKTTMHEFKMCLDCHNEYTNPTNRRFHAQPNACSVCGPSLWLLDSLERKIKTEDPIDYSIEQLKAGKIFAIKGIGGFHLVCDAKNYNSVSLLRERKRRPFKPFAVMMKNLDTVKRYCLASPYEEELLIGFRKPIVLLNRKHNSMLPENIAPNQNTLGVMLPFTPLHELLFSSGIDVLIMTSANSYGLPLEYKNESAVRNLSHIVDFFLMHNREIHTSIDDTVTRIFEERNFMIRRARGYAPEPLRYKCEAEILSSGPNMKNTFAISKDNFIFMSQHNGDLENLETFERYKNNIEHFKKIFRFSPEYVACDMHPEYASTLYADSLNIPVIPVQHHHAHIVGCMVENKILDREVIGIAYDGTGFGTDGKVWGGEYLICDTKSFSRSAHLKYVSLPGGEAAIKEPWKMACSYIYNSFKNHDIYKIDDVMTLTSSLFGEESKYIIKMLEKNINCTDTSSIGRLFDAVSAMLGICKKATYEGQASIELEQRLKSEIVDEYQYTINLLPNDIEFDIPVLTTLTKTENSLHSNLAVLDVSKAILGILEDLKNNITTDIISAKFHNTVISMTVEMCLHLRDRTAIRDVVLSGGVFQNLYILHNIKSRLEKEDFDVYIHSEYPSNDGSIALGQIVVANEVIKENKAFKI